MFVSYYFQRKKMFSITIDISGITGVRCEINSASKITVVSTLFIRTLVFTKKSETRITNGVAFACITISMLQGEYFNFSESFFAIVVVKVNRKRGKGSGCCFKTFYHLCASFTIDFIVLPLGRKSRFICFFFH